MRLRETMKRLVRTRQVVFSTMLTAILVSVILESRASSNQNKIASSIVAERIVLVDSKGKERAVLGFDKRESAGLDGKAPAELVRLTLYSETGDKVAELSQSGSEKSGPGTPSLVIHDYLGREKIRLYTTLATEQAGLSIISNDGTERLELGTDASRSASLSIMDPSGFPRLDLGYFAAGDAAISLSDKAAPVKFVREPTITLSAHKDTGSLITVCNDGRKPWYAPPLIQETMPRLPGEPTTRPAKEQR